MNGKLHSCNYHSDLEEFICKEKKEGLLQLINVYSKYLETNYSCNGI